MMSMKKIGSKKFLASDALLLDRLPNRPFGKPQLEQEYERLKQDRL